MNNDLVLKTEEIKNDKELYNRYAVIINSPVTEEVVQQFKADIEASKKVSEKEANALLGELFYSTGNYLEAFNAYTKSKINTDDVNGDFFGGLWGKLKAVLKKGKVVSNKMFLDEEMAKFNYFDTILRLNGNDANVISLYERSLKKSPKMLKFEENYKLMYETNKDEFDMCVKVKVQAAMAYCRSNDKKGYEKGFKLLNELFTTIEDTREYITNDVANKMIFYLMDKKESFEKIINTYYRYIELDNENNETLNIHLGKYFFDNGRFELAKEHLKRTKDPRSRILLARIYFNENKSDNMYKVFDLIKGNANYFTTEEDYYMASDAYLYMYYHEQSLEPLEVISVILSLKEFVLGNKEGKKAPKINPYYLGELSDLYFFSNDLINASSYAKDYYEQIKDNKKPVSEYEAKDDLNSYHLHRGRGLFVEKRYYEAYGHMSALGNYALVKDEILELIMHIVDYTTKDYDDRLTDKFDEFIDIVKKVFPKKRKKRYSYLGNIYMKKCFLEIDFKRSYKLGKKYLGKNISNLAKRKNLIEFYKENKKRLKEKK